MNLRALLAGVLLAAGCSPSAPPPFFPAALPSPKADVFDAAALQVESFLTDFADRLQQRAATDAALAFAGDFEGIPPLSPPSTAASTRAAAGGLVAIAEHAGIEASPSDPSASLAAFLRSVREIDSARLKMPAMEFWEQGVFGTVKLEISGLAASRFSLQEQFDAVLVLRDGEWKFRKLRRTARREVRSAGPLVRDVAAAAGLVGARESGPAHVHSPFDTLRGCAAGDLDGDGWLDLVLVSPLSIHVFRNDRNGRFEDVTAASGIRSASPAAAVLAWDPDGDGDLDLAISQCVWKGSPLGQPDPRAVVLWRNDGGLKFADVTAMAGIDSHGPATGLAAADVNGDGRLDLYVCMYGMHGADALPHQPLRARNGAPNQLWLSRPDGTFVESAAKAGVADPGFSYAAAFGDLDGDRHPDLYLANDFGPHKLYRNRGDGTWEERPADRGFGMGVSWGDFDNDGDFDLYVSNMYSNAGKRLLRAEKAGLPKDVYEQAAKASEGNTLLRNDGGVLADATAAAGVGPAGWAWSNAFVDLDNDGLLDLYAVNGYVSGRSKRDR